MAEDKLRAAVIGAGVGGGHGYAYARAPEYEFAAVCDINPEVLARFYERAEIERGSVAEYSDYREMLERERLDVVSVATPDHLHADPVCDAVAAGVRGIFCREATGDHGARTPTASSTRSPATTRCCRWITRAVGCLPIRPCARPFAAARSAV